MYIKTRRINYPIFYFKKKLQRTTGKMKEKENFDIIKMVIQLNCIIVELHTR